MIPLPDQRAFLSDQLDKLTNVTALNSLSRFIEEIDGDFNLKTAIEHRVCNVPSFRTKSWDSLLRLGLYRCAQYAIIRSMKGSSAIETGVLHGLTSAFILAAMKKNGMGRLVSIDLPSTFEAGPSNRDGFQDTLPPALPSGWIVPDELRSHWNLRIGSSRELLTNACREASPLDFFVHDSEHTYETMMFEFTTVWPMLRDGGILLSDNIDCNTSFFDFCCQIGRIPYVAPVDPDNRASSCSGIRFGLIRK